jgi:putative resolvase
MYSPSAFGRLINRSVSTLQRWDRNGVLTAHRNPQNRRFYTKEQYLNYMGLKPQKKRGRTIAYTRVTVAGQKVDLNKQIEALEIFCTANGIDVDDWYSETGSGLNYERKKFNKLLIDIETGKVSRLVLAHQDRLIRFGYEWIEQFAKRHGCEIIVIDQEQFSPIEEVTQDILAIDHLFSSRLYGIL